MVQQQLSTEGKGNSKRVRVTVNSLDENPRSRSAMAKSAGVEGSDW